MWAQANGFAGQNRVAFPMAGVAMIGVISLDFVVLTNLPRLKRALS